MNILLINVHGAILDTPDFCSNLSLKLEKLHHDQPIIVEGDFNLIINMNLYFKKNTKTLTIKR